MGFLLINLLLMMIVILPTSGKNTLLCLKILGNFRYAIWTKNQQLNLKHCDASNLCLYLNKAEFEKRNSRETKLAPGFKVTSEFGKLDEQAVWVVVPTIKTADAQGISKMYV